MLPVRLLGIAAENRVFHHDHGYALGFETLLDFGDVWSPLISNTLSLVIPAGLEDDDHSIWRHRRLQPVQHLARSLPVDAGVDDLHLKALLGEEIFELRGIVLAAADTFSECVAGAKGYDYAVGRKASRRNGDHKRARQNAQCHNKRAAEPAHKSGGQRSSVIHQAMIAVCASA
jgi:hypothetical protein